MLYGSANRDVAEFGDDADRLDVRRDAPRHLGFSSGPHFCIGSHLAKLQARVAFEELLAAHPEDRCRPLGRCPAPLGVHPWVGHAFPRPASSRHDGAHAFPPRRPARRRSRRPSRRPLPRPRPTGTATPHTTCTRAPRRKAPPFRPAPTVTSHGVDQVSYRRHVLVVVLRAAPVGPERHFLGRVLPHPDQHWA